MCIICMGTYQGETEIKIYGCNELVEIPPLPSVRIFVCKFCRNLEKIGDMPVVTDIEIDSCNKLRKIGTMTSLKKLSVRSCETLASLPYTFGKATVWIFDCPMIKNRIGDMEFLSFISE
jgi:hypothetical protein